MIDVMYTVMGRSILTGQREALTVPCTKEKVETVKRKYSRKGGSWYDLKVEPFIPDLFKSRK